MIVWFRFVLCVCFLPTSFVVVDLAFSLAPTVAVAVSQMRDQIRHRGPYLTCPLRHITCLAFLSRHGFITFFPRQLPSNGAGPHCTINRRSRQLPPSENKNLDTDNPTQDLGVNNEATGGDRRSIAGTTCGATHAVQAVYAICDADGYPYKIE